MKKSKKPLVSVIMGVYNGMPYLSEAIESILKQTYKNLEFIIVDDASTDNSWIYLKKIKDHRLILVRNINNIGLAASLNKGLKIAKGNYIARMDADDISLPKRIETQLIFMNKHPKIHICGTWVAIVDNNNKKTGSVHYPTIDVEIKKVLRRVTPMIHPTWFAKKDLFIKLDGYLGNWDYVEDYEFLLRARTFKMANIPSELLMWRSQSNRRSNKYVQKIYEKSLKLKWKYFREGELDISYIPYLLRALISTYLFPPVLKIYLNNRTGRT